MWILSRFQFNEKFTIYLVLNLIGTGNFPINWGYKPWKHRNPVPIPSLTSSTKPKSRSQSPSQRQKLSFYYSRIARMPNSLFTTLQQCKLCVRVISYQGRVKVAYTLIFYARRTSGVVRRSSRTTEKSALTFWSSGFQSSQ